MTSINNLFHDNKGDVGKITAALFDQIEGQNAQDVMCALAFITAFIIDCSPDKKESLEEFMDVTSKLIHFDRPAFKGPDVPQLQ